MSSIEPLPLALQHFTIGDFAKAAEFCWLELQANPDSATAYHLVGVCMGRLDNVPASIKYLRRAIALDPGVSEYHCNLATSLSPSPEALSEFRRAIALDPANVIAHRLLAALAHDFGRHTESLAHYRAALALAPTAREWGGLALGLREIGDISAAIAAADQCIALDPGNPVPMQARAFEMLYSDTHSAAEKFQAHVELGQFIESHVAPLTTSPAPHDGPLRVGLVSPDFRWHPVAAFLEPLLRHHDRTRVAITAYADVPRPDAVTERLGPLFDRYVPIHGVSDADVAAQIQADGVDVLIDLAGHTQGNRLLLFAMRPCPVQMTWLGYPSTTGLGRMGWRVVDEHTDPAGSLATEDLLRMPSGFLCWQPPEFRLPVTRRGSKRLTFGSFNNVAKLAPSCLRMWGEILRRRPKARLLLKAAVLADEGVCGRLRADLVRYGASRNQVDFAPLEPDPKRALARYGEIDLHLDSSPYTGTTTTAESLWMGVPVLTLEGETHAERVSAAMMRRCGLSGFVARSTEEYVALACELPGMLPSRETVRARMLAKVCDGARFAMEWEEMVRGVFSAACGTTAHPVNPSGATPSPHSDPHTSG